MDVLLDLSCFHGASKATYSILHVINTAASVTLRGESATGRLHSKVTNTRFHQGHEAHSFTHRRVFRGEKVSAKHGYIP